MELQQIGVSVHYSHPHYGLNYYLRYYPFLNLPHPHYKPMEVPAGKAASSIVERRSFVDSTALPRGQLRVVG